MIVYLLTEWFLAFSFWQSSFVLFLDKLLFLSYWNDVPNQFFYILHEAPIFLVLICCIVLVFSRRCALIFFDLISSEIFLEDAC